MPGKYQVVLDGDVIGVYTRYSERDTAKSIAGYKWRSKRRRWEYPADPTTAIKILDAFQDKTVDPAVEHMAHEQERALKHAEAARDNDNLPDVPNSKTSAWNHQRQAYWFSHDLKRNALFMAMGTGKSKVVVDLVVNRGHKNTVIVCPKAVVGVWPREFRRHAGEPITVVAPEGSVSDRVAAIKQGWQRARVIDHDAPCVAVVNYGAILYDPLKSWLKNTAFDYMVLDESHKIKAPGGKQSRFLYRVGKDIEHKTIATGTPMPNSPLDIYGQYRFLEPSIFGTRFAAFRSEYAVVVDYGGFPKIVEYKNQSDLHEKMYRIAFRVTDDVLDLPDEVDMLRTTTLSSKERRAYEELENEFIYQVESGEIATVANAAVKVIRLQQVTSGYVVDEDGDQHTVGDSKKKLLADVLDEIGKNEPVVVFARFHRDLDNIREIVEEMGLRAGELSGRQSDLTDDAEMPDDIDVLAVQVQSGNAGIDLTRARYAIYYSIGHSLGDYLQSKKRLHRPGQERAVRYIHLACAGTIDEKVMAALESKQEIVKYVLDDMGIKLPERVSS